MTRESIEKRIKDLLSANTVDFDELDEFIEEHEDDYLGVLAEYAFREAVRMSNTSYVEEHIDDFDLNDGDGYSTYLNETEDKKTQEILIFGGAIRSLEDYDDCKFAMETTNGEVLVFDEDFQWDVFEKYKKVFNFTDEKLQELLDGDCYDEESDRDVDVDLEILGVSLDDGGADFEDKSGSDGYELMDLLETLGWNCDFEGDSSKFETIGVYFIR